MKVPENSLSDSGNLPKRGKKQESVAKVTPEAVRLIASELGALEAPLRQFQAQAGRINTDLGYCVMNAIDLFLGDLRNDITAVAGDVEQADYKPDPTYAAAFKAGKSLPEHMESLQPSTPAVANGRRRNIDEETAITPIMVAPRENRATTEGNK